MTNSNINTESMNFDITMYLYILSINSSWFMVFNTTFNNISDILWQSVLLVKETGVPRENYWPVKCHWQTLSHNVVSSKPPHEREFKLNCLHFIQTTYVSFLLRKLIIWNLETSGLSSPEINVNIYSLPSISVK